MKATKRSSDDGVHGDGWGWGTGDGSCPGTGHAFGKSANYGQGRGSPEGWDNLDFGWHPVPSANEDMRRTERVFRCPGCIGGYECSIHGRKL